MYPAPDGDQACKRPAPSGTGLRGNMGYSAVFATVLEAGFLASTTS